MLDIAIFRPDFLLASFSWAVALASLLAAVYLTITTVQALRAKARAKYMIQLAMRRNDMLRMLSSRQVIEEQDIFMLRRMIEDEIKELGEGDRVYMHQALHQTSETGIRQVLFELLGRA